MIPKGVKYIIVTKMPATVNDYNLDFKLPNTIWELKN